MTTHRNDPFLHHPDGTHRSTAPTANGSDLERFERRIVAHLADGHDHVKSSDVVGDQGKNA